MKSVRFNRFALLAAVLLLVSSLTITGCKTDDDDSPKFGTTEFLTAASPLVGTWTSTYAEKYAITTTDLTNGYTSGGTYIETYKGNNLVVVYTNAYRNAGYIYIKYTKSMNADYTYSETAPDVGKWYALSFKDLTLSSLKISGAYKASGTTSTSTLAEAISTFTIANGYFSTYSECSK